MASTHRPSTPPMQIILARVEEEFTVHKTPGYGTKLTPKLTAKTVLWKHRGSPTDLKKAEKYANEEGWSVFSYPLSVKDARVRAAEAVLERSKR